jgi:hypothetical protein
MAKYDHPAPSPLACSSTNPFGRACTGCLPTTRRGTSWQGMTASGTRGRWNAKGLAARPELRRRAKYAAPTPTHPAQRIRDPRSVFGIRAAYSGSAQRIGDWRSVLAIGAAYRGSGAAYQGSLQWDSGPCRAHPPLRHGLARCGTVSSRTSGPYSLINQTQLRRGRVNGNQQRRNHRGTREGHTREVGKIARTTASEIVPRPVTLVKHDARNVVMVV